MSGFYVYNYGNDPQSYKAKTFKFLLVSLKDVGVEVNILK